MQLTEDQKRAVTQWLSQGAKLSEVQERLNKEFSLRLTYMEARLLVDDLKLVPQETAAPEEPKAEDAPQAVPAPQPGGVRVEMDSLVRPGALVSGKVAFSDGVTAEWSLDHTGRFSLLPSKEGYRPSQPDLDAFRAQLQTELAKKGF